MSLARCVALVAASLAAVLLACASTTSTAGRRAYLDAHPELDPALRQRIERGEVGPGMTLEQVQATLGPPDSRRTFEESGRVEIWTYPGALVARRITRAVNDLDFRVRLIFRDGVLERLEDL